MSTQQAIRRGILQGFDTSTYTATVLIIEATNYVLNSVPIANSVDGTSAISGANCAVLFFDESNYTDAVIIAVYGIAPTPPPGRITFLAVPVLEVSGVVINNGVTTTFTLTGPPAGALGVLCRAFFSSPTVGAWIGIAPHGGATGNYFVVGNEPTANLSINGNAIMPIDAAGKIDIQANTGNCTVSLYSYGYIL
ncbi:MAG: hypothetical protein ABI413_05825 [Ktedonobacteraceae bacterium]